VSFGSDAHQPWRVAGKFRLAADIAQAAGFAPGRDRFDFWRAGCPSVNGQVLPMAVDTGRKLMLKGRIWLPAPASVVVCGTR
jgi:hypothetical protein